MQIFSAVVYTFLALVYEYFVETRAYLEMNKRTKGAGAIPSNHFRISVYCL